MTTNNNVKVEGWEALAEVLGIMRTNMNSENSVPSVEIKGLVGGLVQKTVKVYNADPFKASSDAQSIYNDLVAKYG